MATNNTGADDDRRVEEIESLCMNCQENGTTRMLLTNIPYFREVVLMSFSCPHCHFQNNEIQSAGSIQQQGVKYTFRMNVTPDLQRQVVKSDTAVVRIEEIDLEIPAGRGQLTNIEGLISMVKTDLESGQPQRKEIDETIWEKIGAIIAQLESILKGQGFPVTISIDDPAGNSSIEPNPSDRSGKYTRAEYARTAAQNEALGIGGGEASEAALEPGDAPSTVLRPEYRAADTMYPSLPDAKDSLIDQDDDSDIVADKVYTFLTPCPGCMKESTINMKMVKIPHFDEVVIMSTSCPHCGYRSNEVKTGGAIPAKGRILKLRCERAEDLSRDILKASSAVLEIPELHLNVEPGTMGGRFTTVEGLLVQVRNDLKGSIFEGDEAGDGSQQNVANQEFVTLKQGDSMPAHERKQWDAFFGGLDRAIAGDASAFPFTVIIKDPMAASYVQSFKAPDPDEQIETEDYERSAEEEEDLGLKDMNTANQEGNHDNNADDIQDQIQKRLKEIQDQEEKENSDR